jgi:hypothetical protein
MKHSRGYDSRVYHTKVARMPLALGRYAFSKPDDLPELKLAMHVRKVHKGAEDASCYACKELRSKLL